MKKIDKELVKYNDMTEDEIISLLRDNEFIEKSDSVSITTLLSKLSFKYIFNFLQNNIIYNKTSSLSFNLLNTDKYLINGFLDSIKLCVKLDNRMFYKLLMKLSHEEIIDFIKKDYILNCLDDEEIINILVIKNINLVSLKELLNNRITQNFLITYLNKLWELKFDIDVILDLELLKTLYSLDDNIINKIDVNDFNYLITTILNKESLSLNSSKISVLTIKSLLLCYIKFGISNTLKILFNDKNYLSTDELKFYMNYYVNEKMGEYLSTSGIYLDKLDINIIKTFKGFDEEIKLSYLDNKVFNYLEKFNIDKVKLIRVINRFINYQYVNYDEAVSEVREYVNKIKEEYFLSIRNNYTREYFYLIKDLVKLKKKVKDKRLKEINGEVITNIKFQLLYKLLTNSINDSDLFKKNVVVEKKVSRLNDFISDKISFNEYLKNVIIPLSNGSFNIDEYLLTNSFVKPSNYDYFNELMGVRNRVVIFNKYLRKLKKNKNIDDLEEISSRFINGISNVDLIYDKRSNKILFNNLFNSYLDDDCLNYYNAYKLISSIVDYSTKLVNSLFKNSRVSEVYYNELYSEISSLNVMDYIPVVKLFNLNDLEVFSGLDFDDSVFDNTYFEYLINNKAFVLMFTKVINNPSKIISSSNDFLMNNNVLSTNFIECLNINKKLNSSNIRDVLKCYDVNYYSTLDDEYLKSIFDRSVKNYEKYVSNIYIDNLITIRSLNNYESLIRVVNSKEYDRTTELEMIDDVLVTYYEVIGKDKSYFKTKLDGNNLIVSGNVSDDVLDIFSDYILSNYKYISYVTTDNLSNTNYFTNYLNDDLVIIKSKNKEYSNVYKGELLNLVNSSYTFTNSIVNKNIFKRIKLIFNDEDLVCSFDELYFDNYNVIIKSGDCINQKINNYLSI